MSRPTSPVVVPGPMLLRFAKRATFSLALGWFALPLSAQPDPANTTTITNEILFSDNGSNFNLGYAMAVGDFDNDGWDDLAIGAEGWRNAANVSGGAVGILYGDASGFLRPGVGADRMQVFHQDSAGIANVVEELDGFGGSLAVGDFDDDDYDDLAIGVRHEDFELCLPACMVTEDVGGVHVLYGSETGLTSDGAQFLQQGFELPGDLEEGDQVGYSLAAGDFDLDGYFDLAIGAPGESLETGSTIESGAINVIFGGKSGLDEGRTLFWHQDTAGIEDVANSFDHWGEVLTVGNFRGLLDPNVPIDLVVGSPDDLQGGPQGGPGEHTRGGSVQLLQGSVLGLLTTNDVYYSLEDSLIPGANEEDAHFGTALAVGDFDDDGYDDLAIGAENKDSGGVVEDAGLVYVISSAGAGGLDLTGGVQVWGQDTGGVLEVAEMGDHFGEKLLAADVDDDEIDDLIVGAPDEDLAAGGLAGVVHVLYGTNTGLTADDDELFDHQIVGSTNESGERFGWGLAAGRFEPMGTALAVAAPFRDIDVPGFSYFGAGVVEVIGPPGLIFRDFFESGDTTAWSTTVP